jgi:hypothetical protein
VWSLYLMVTNKKKINSSWFKAKKDNIEALGDNVLKRLGDLNDDALNEHFETRQSLFLAMLSCGRRPHSQHSPHSSPVGEAVGNSAERRQTETDLLWNMDVAFRGWGSKEESTVVDKEVSELSVSERRSTTRNSRPSTSSNNAGSNGRPGTSSDVSARPRFCHNVCCSMLGKPVYQAIHVLGCCVCSKKILKAKPSDKWQHLLEPECGPALHTASWRMSPALPAPSLGCGYGAGRKVRSLWICQETLLTHGI